MSSIEIHGVAIPGGILWLGSECRCPRRADPSTIQCDESGSGELRDHKSLPFRDCGGDRRSKDHDELLKYLRRWRAADCRAAAGKILGLARDSIYVLIKIGQLIAWKNASANGNPHCRISL